MSKHLFKKIGLLRRITLQIKTLKEALNSAIFEMSENTRSASVQTFFVEASTLLDIFQDIFSPDAPLPEVPDYEEYSPEEVDFSLVELLVIFRRILQKLQQSSLTIQHNALDILHSYFIELQGLYDLVFMRRFVSNTEELPISLFALEEYHKRYFRCFKFTDQAFTRLRQGGISEEILRKLEPLKDQKTVTEDQCLSALESMLGKQQSDQYQFAILKHTQVLQYMMSDSIIREYKSIQYDDLMKNSSLHHLRVVLFKLFPRFAVTMIKEFFKRKPRCRHIQDPEQIDTVEKLQEFFAKHPLTETAKLSIALHRHIMRILDIVFTRGVLRWGRPVFELLILGTWLQTVKDHILPGFHTPRWQADHLDLSQDKEQEVQDANGAPGKIRMSSAFFMQPRVKFGLERFLIFKLRTMTVGDIVRTTELGNWMRQNSPDEFLQFFNIALGDMGGLGIRTMPEHEITETKDTLWLYSALMTFVPGGVTSPGSIVMREENYGLTKSQQLFHEIRYYDPRFKKSSSLFMDIRKVVQSLSVLNKGRIGDALKKTESFEGKKRGV